MSQQPSLAIFDSSSPSPTLFDGTTRLYICVKCPYAQRVWIGRNYKRLDNIDIVAINLEDKPKWYLEKVYPPGKVPSLEHNGKVIGESLDLLEYLDQNFEGPPLFPKEAAKEESRKELWTFAGKFTASFSKAFKDKGADKVYSQENLGPLLDNLEVFLSKFDNEGPFFLGQISAVDFAYAPFIQRYELGCFHFFDYNIFEGRPKLSNWFEAMNAVDAYKYTKHDPKVILHRLRTLAGRL